MEILFKYCKACDLFVINRLFLAIAISIFLIVSPVGNVSYCQIQKRDSLVKVLQSTDNSKDSVKLLIALSEWYIRVDFRKAVKYANQALEIANIAGDKIGNANAMSHRALIHWYNGEYSSSIRLNKESINLREQTGDSLGMANNYQKIAFCYYYTADYDSAILFHELALPLFRKHGSDRQVATQLNQMALVYNKMSDYKNSVVYLYEFAKLRHSFEGYKGRTYNLLQSTPFFRSKEYFQAELELQLKALNELLKEGSDIDILFTNLNIADSYRELNNPIEVLHYLQQADVYYSKVRWMPNYYGLGNAFLKVNKIDSAIIQYKEGIKLTKEKGTQISLMTLHTGLGDAFAKKGDYNGSIQELVFGLEMTSKMHHKLDMVLTMLKISEVYVKLKQWNVAQQYCDKSLKLATQIKARKQIKDALYLKSDLLKSLGEHERALDFFTKAKKLSDSLLFEEADYRFAEMQAQFEVGKKDRDIDQLSQEKELQVASIKNKDQLIIGFVVVLVLIIMLAISTYLRYRLKTKANKVLVEQKRQIEMLLSEVHHRVKNNLQVISSLLSIQSDQLEDQNARMAVLEGQSRVQAMGLIHENIYKTENFAFIQMDEYLLMMTNKLIESYGYAEGKLKVEINTSEISVDVDTAIHIGLIINELMTNSLKYAFQFAIAPRIWIKLFVEENKLLALEVRDNGSGFQGALNKNSFGLKLVTELVAQMGGSTEFIHDSGLLVSIKLKKFNLAA